MTALNSATPKNAPKTSPRNSEFVLQVIALSGDTVIASEQLDERAERTAFTVGFDVDADYPVRSALLPEASAYTFAELKTTAYMSAGRPVVEWVQLINIPYGATGEILCDGELFDIVELREAGRLRRDEARGCDTLKLPAGARCRVNLGEDTFVFCSLPRPKALKRLSLRERFDRGFLYTIASAAAIMMTCATTISLIPEAPSALEIRHVPVVERFVPVELSPQEQVSDRETIDVSDSPDSGGEERADSQTRPSHSKRGSKRDSKRDSKPRTASADQGGEDAKTRARAAARDLIAGSGLSAVNQGISEESLAQLRGQDQNVHAERMRGVNGPAAVRRTAKFYRHTVNSEGTPCLVQEGDRMISPCLGTAGNRRKPDVRGRIRPHKTRRPPITTGRPHIDGQGLTREEVRRTIISRMVAYKHCYERALQGARGLKGRVEVKLIINAQGRVVLAKLTKNELAQPSVGRCIIKQMKLLRFPNAKDGSRTTVKYPLVFRAS